MLLSNNHTSESLKKIVDRVNFEAKFPNPQDICVQICYTVVYTGCVVGHIEHAGQKTAIIFILLAVISSQSWSK